MTVMAKILFGQIGTQENQMIGEKEKIVSEAMTVVQLKTNGMMTSVVRNIQSYVKSQCVKNLMPMTTTLILRRKAIQTQKLLVKALVENSLNLHVKKFIMKLVHLQKQKELVIFGWEYMT